MSRTLIYAIDENRIYEVYRTDEKWYYGNPTMESLSIGGVMERSFLKDGGEHFHIISEVLAKQLANKNKTEIIKMLLGFVR